MPTVSIASMNYAKQKAENRDAKYETFEENYQEEIEAARRTQMVPAHTTGVKPTYSQYHDSMSSDTFNFEQYRNTKESEVNIMALDQLKHFAKSLHQEIRKCENTEPLNPVKARQETLQGLMKDRDKFKQLFVQEQKRHNDQKVVKDSQRRIIEKAHGGSFVSTQ